MFAEHSSDSALPSAASVDRYTFLEAARRAASKQRQLPARPSKRRREVVERLSFVVVEAEPLAMQREEVFHDLPARTAAVHAVTEPALVLLTAANLHDCAHHFAGGVGERLREPRLEYGQHLGRQANRGLERVLCARIPRARQELRDVRIVQTHD